MHRRMHTYTNIHTYTYIHTYIHTHTHTHTHSEAGAADMSSVLQELERQITEARNKDEIDKFRHEGDMAIAEAGVAIARGTLTEARELLERGRKAYAAAKGLLVYVYTCVCLCVFVACLRVQEFYTDKTGTGSADQK
jgi:hypothetical protein